MRAVVLSDALSHSDPDGFWKGRRVLFSRSLFRSRLLGRRELSRPLIETSRTQPANRPGSLEGRNSLEMTASGQSRRSTIGLKRRLRPTSLIQRPLVHASSEHERMSEVGERATTAECRLVGQHARGTRRGWCRPSYAVLTRRRECQFAPEPATHGYGFALSNPARCAALPATIFAVSVTLSGVAFKSLKSVAPIASPTQ